METPQQVQHTERRIPWIRIAIAIVAVVFLGGAATLWALSAEKIIKGSWSDILPIIFTVLGIGVPIFLYLFPFSAPTDTRPNPRGEEIAGKGIAGGQAVQPSAPVAVSSGALFFFCEPLTNPSEFYGRLRERQTLLDRTYKGASTSIVGPRRIGKTWLLSYLKLIAPAQLGERFHVGYLDATAPGCSTVAGFTNRALQELGIPTFASKRTLGLAALEKAVQELSAKNQPLVLCIDEFEGLDNRQEFDLHFFTGLRAMASAGLVLVIASKSPLIEIVGDPGHTSGFFNIFQQLTLEPFSDQEAEKFAQAKGAQAHFTADERARLLQYGQRLPIRLQLVGQMLVQDKTLAAKEDSNLYRPKDPSYWQQFEERLEQTYRGVVHP